MHLLSSKSLFYFFITLKILFPDQLCLLPSILSALFDVYFFPTQVAFVYCLAE